jgi:hypothetical protein
MGLYALNDVIIYQNVFKWERDIIMSMDFNPDGKRAVYNIKGIFATP